MPFLEQGREPPAPPDDAFLRLVQDLSLALGPSSGLDSEGGAPYALRDANRAYTRNLVDEGNGKSNLPVLDWNPSRNSAIHDHANAHCILQGSLQEALYTWPDQGKIKRGEPLPLHITKETVHTENQVTYMSDKISNPDPEKVAVSLHRK
ncbi:hypothetical protein ASPZODRAFT_158574 [Penicilliopsis zonata CBS 506.65]|uniref:Cysteine dioxygenase n=1 Tax=Penicilliopsis zonata CBS 506.65 TaxID=1073090 RepID=A0A1L9SKB2_9EURO|nr:hypothetical protein ASPZODRAFT_158574 [Penicilliopsis zonata CBS 506.65]OJJ47650.1 hypothetical protein ASPZODRAFT_158574 [Penicilliopsis zonata CBS 506.65]